MKRFAALAAVFAVTLQALWPLLSHARPKNESLLAPVCTVDGVTHYLDLKTGKTPLDERSAQHGEHCKMCVFGDGKEVALVAPDFLPFLFKNYSKQNSETPKASFHQATLLPAHPRAPPAIA
jgi:hypothetical protein